MAVRRSALSSKRGNYAILIAMLSSTIVGFGAFAVDVSYARLAQSQAQDVADAASQAALLVLRRTGDLDAARQAAVELCALNTVAGTAPELQELEFGVWDHTVTPGIFTPTLVSPNAVRVEVGRSGANAVPMFLSRVWGYEGVAIANGATSASRSLHALLVMDITGSWDRTDFRYARDAALVFYDTLAGSYGDTDMLGMNIFTGRYAWEYTPMAYLQDEVPLGSVRDDWTRLERASKAGTPAAYPRECTLNVAPNVNNFLSPAGGCYPNMPREYRDELGTDHTTGLTMARDMFEDNPDPTAYRAMIVLTDGRPNGLAAGQGAQRAAAGYVESRWSEYAGPVPRTISAIKSESVLLTEEMWDDLEVHTWVVSFVQSDPFMEDMVQGDGRYQNTTSASALVDIFEQIANELPLTLVE